MLKYRKDLKVLARNLRTRMTDAELKLWNNVRRRQLKGLQFYRQKPIGSYIVDFYCPKANLVIELDGGQHNEVNHEVKDSIRDEFLKQLGLRVLRFSNLDVLKNVEGVVHKILEVITNPS